jgi:hypothetical protein
MQQQHRLDKMKYDFGDSVQLADNLKPCAVVGVTHVESVQQAEALNVPLGTVLYTVEFGDGSDALVPEAALQLTRPT